MLCGFFGLQGGLKAAITADVIQGVTVVAVSVLVVVKGVINSGGLENVYNINNDNGKCSFAAIILLILEFCANFTLLAAI